MYCPLIINQDSWTGLYFKDIPIEITAHAKPGYKFKEWIGHNEKSLQLTEAFSETTSLIAIFEETDNEHESIVINEINYRSSEDAKAGDWIELYNTSDVTIDLSGWKLMDTEPNNVFTLPNETSLAPLAYLVLVDNFDDFTAIHPNVENIQGMLSFGLSSTYDVIKLIDKNNYLIDSVYYESTSPWPSEPNGQGSTLALTNPRKDNTIITNWYASEVTNGTPGKKNTLATSIDQKPVAGNSIIAIRAYPNPLANETQIEFNIQEPDKVKLEVIDYKGARISTVCNKNFQAGKHTIPWQATDINGSPLANGLYFVTITHRQQMQQSIKLLIVK